MSPYQTLPNSTWSRPRDGLSCKCKCQFSLLTLLRPQVPRGEQAAAKASVSEKVTSTGGRKTEGRRQKTEDRGQKAVQKR